MGFSGMAGFTYHITLWVARLFYLNVLWVLFTVAGVGILGIFPSTLAMLFLIKIWLEDRTQPVFKTFLKIYKENFVKANLLGWIVSPIFVLLIYLGRESLTLNNPLSIWLTMGIGGGILIVGSYLLFLFPVCIQYQGSLKKTFLNTFFVTVVSPHYFIGISIIWALIMFVLLYTGFFIFFFGSVSAWIIMKGADLLFRSIRFRQHKEKQNRPSPSLESI